MCGIFGVVGKNVKKEEIEKALASLSRRGPDDQGTFVSSDCVLGHTRLSIIDIGGGHQPMVDSELSITFNGEIYNFKELRTTLESKGHRFATHSDTEVILKCYREYGAECPKQLDGMFAFAIWDGDKKELFLARDRFGKKPLYYAFADGALIIASEIKALIAVGIKGEVDPQSIDNYLSLMYIPPWKSIYKNVHVLPPAHYASYKSGKIRMERYWEMTKNPIIASYEEAKNELKKLFDEAVSKRMIADVEIGTLLSGGVDSTLVTAYAQRHSPQPLKTFTLSYGDYINELPYAEEASRKIGTDHYSLLADSALIDELESVIAYMDEPHADSSNFPQQMLSRLVASKVKVALSGDGADELFMGYGWYWKYWNLPRIVRVKNLFFSNPFNEFIKNVSVFSEKERGLLWKDIGAMNQDILGDSVRLIKENDINKINIFDLTTYLPGQLLTKVDRTSMMHGLEVRSPFLDYKLAEYVYNLPTEYKMNSVKGGKIILKDILGEIMPQKFVNRRKQGFGAPVEAWLKTSYLAKLLRNIIMSDSSSIYDFLHPTYPRYIYSDFLNTPMRETAYKLWSLLVLELWLKNKR